MKNKLKIILMIFVTALIFRCNNSSNHKLCIYDNTSRIFRNLTDERFLFDKQKIQVICFFSYHCPMSIKQVPYLNLLKEKYGNDIEITLVIPEDSIEDIQTFESSNILNFRVLLDKELLLAKELNATVTPQYFVYKEGERLYSGSFDNKYAAVNVPNNQEKYVNYVEDCIRSSLKNYPVGVNETKAIGCYIDRG